MAQSSVAYPTVVGVSLFLSLTLLHGAILLFLSGRREGGVAMAAMMAESQHPLHRNKPLYLLLLLLATVRNGDVLDSSKTITTSVYVMIQSEHNGGYI